MKKVLFALDDNHLSQGAFDFVTRMNEKEPVLLTGIYIPAFINDLAWSTPGGEDALFIPRLLNEDEAMIRGNIQGFKDACITNSIDFRVHGDIGYSILEGLQKETRFADLLVIGLDNYYASPGEDYVHGELKRIIEKAECPVLLIPAKSSYPDNIVIAYDGSAASTYALKLFTYLFPSMTTIKTLVVHASLDTSTFPDEDYIKELAARHFSDLTFSSLEFEPKKYFSTWIEDRPNTLLVTGSYGRSGVSQLFNTSFMDEILKCHDVPVFIAHK